MHADSNFTLFADDTTALIKANSLDQLRCRFSSCMDKIREWLDSNGLAINNSKSALIDFKTSCSNHPDLVGTGDFELVESVNFLGVQINNNLGWQHEIDSCSKKLCKASYLISMLSGVVNDKTHKSVYYAYFYSIMRYSIIF
jgi:hypothetical protein